MAKDTVFVSGSFDDLRSRQVRFLEEAARLGPVQVLLWSDSLVRRLEGKNPKFPRAERQYFVEAIRFVEQVILIDELESADCLPSGPVPPSSTWAVSGDTASIAKSDFCGSMGIHYHVIPEEQLQVIPWQPSSAPLPASVPPPAGKRKKVIVTGCYDWLHTGHVRFFEESSQLGDLYVVIGSDANVRMLKGKGHPLYGEAVRLYMVQAIRYVAEARVSSGSGWMDAEPEIDHIRPDVYVVNEDGDRPEKRAFCQEHELEYVILKRLPKEGLPRRESTQLRGF